MTIQLRNRRISGRSAANRAANFNARERRKSLLDPTHRLFKTHSFALDATGLDTDVIFPDLNVRMTFGFKFKRTGAASNGVFFEFGSAARGIAAAIDGSNLYFVSGAGAGVNDGVDLLSTGAVLAENVTYHLVCSILPGLGSANMWLNGQIAAAGHSVDRNFGVGSSDNGNGRVGGVEATITTRIPAGQRATLVDAQIVSDLQVYSGQLPRQFRDFTLGSTSGTGSWSTGFDSGFGG